MDWSWVDSLALTTIAVALWLLHRWALHRQINRIIAGLQDLADALEDAVWEDVRSPPPYDQDADEDE